MGFLDNFKSGAHQDLKTPTQDDVMYMPQQVMPPSSLPMFREEDPEFTKWRLSSDERVEKMLKRALGYRQDNNGEWKVDRHRTPIMNEEGAEAIGSHYDSVCNPAVLQANLETKDLKMLMEETMNTFDGMIFMNARKWAIPRSYWNKLSNEFEINIFSTFTRALGGQERKGIVENVSRTENVVLNPVAKKGLIPGLGFVNR